MDPAPPGGLTHFQIPACGAGRATTLRSVEPGPIHRNHRGELAGGPGVMREIDSGGGWQVLDASIARECRILYGAKDVELALRL
jgi:hypothetical protein